MSTGPTLIFKWKGSNLKRRRSETEKDLRESGWGTSLTEEQMDKLEYVERKAANAGVDDPLFVPPTTIDKIK